MPSSCPVSTSASANTSAHIRMTVARTRTSRSRRRVFEAWERPINRAGRRGAAPRRCPRDAPRVGGEDADRTTESISVIAGFSGSVSE